MIGKKSKYKKLDDNELVALYREKPSGQIIGELYIRFAHLMMGTCLKYLKNKEQAEDTIMEIFESLPDKLKNHSISHFKSWLYMVTKNACLMKLRKKSYPERELNEELVGIIEEKEEKAILEIKLNHLEEAIEDLNEEQKEAIKLFYINRKSYQEVSETMNISAKKVKSAIQNGKRNLKMKLENNDHFKSA